MYTSVNREFNLSEREKKVEHQLELGESSNICDKIKPIV